MFCHNYSQPHPRLRGVRLAAPHDGSAPSFPDGSLSVRQILGSMGFTKDLYSTATAVKVGIVSLGGGVVMADVENTCRWFGCAAPQNTIVLAPGGVDNPADQDPSTEVMLDNEVVMQVVWDQTGKPATIVNCFAANTGPGIAQAVDKLVEAGCSVITISWGQAYDQWDPADIATTEAALQRAHGANVSVFAASGDNSIDDGTASPTPDYPACSVWVTSVGGVFEQLAADGSIAQLTAWGDGLPGDPGGGGGAVAAPASPPWQTGIVPPPPASLGIQGAFIAVPVCSADADPNSGVQGSFNGAPSVVGGTSMAAPLVAALVAVAKGVSGAKVGCVNEMLGKAYPGAFIDVALGSDGVTATKGYDFCTGMGIPNGPRFVQAIC